ncbi:LegC family aminotransferase [Psychroflexus salis]|uniref:GDP-perosamine synthase n=1 Tax=Psychroflexus salis TaxID=1526574 RepID=A0A916ZRT4_9FLAO|nr:LegC family aminotransferase [Psychroflexus salis]GGE10791.1 aminotransferase DegT [Psychroflexus salis]
MNQVKIQHIINFIRKYYGTKDFIPLHAPVFNGNEKAYLNECINSTFVSSVGKFVDEFEIKLAKYVGVKKAVVCVNGTNAIHLCLKLVGVESNDEVITQPLTFIATTNAITYANAIPVFVDVDIDTMGLSPKSMLNFLGQNAEVKKMTCYNKNTGRRIKACLPMHTFGHACRIDEIRQICKEYHIELVEDAAEAMGSKYKGQHLGSFGKLGAISFNGNKIMTTGGGGVIVTDDEELAQQAKHLSTQAKTPHSWEYHHDEIGYNFRMPNLNAALGLAQLEQLDQFLEKKRNLAQAYKTFFEKQGIKTFEERTDEMSNYWLNAVILESLGERNLFLKEMNDAGVMTRPIWQLMTKLAMFQDCPKANLENAEYLEDRVVNIPSSVK